MATRSGSSSPPDPAPVPFATVNARSPSARRHRPRRFRDTTSREDRKEATRQAIIAAALTLLNDRSFSALSLREVTREAGIVPAGFYRHFESMEALGLVLIDESFRSLREMLRAARADRLDPDRVIASTVEILATSVSEQREHWRFIFRERSSGIAAMRYAIRTEIRVITAELATDLGRVPALRSWSTEDLNLLAGLVVNAMLLIAETIHEAPDRKAVDEITRTAVKQLRMIMVGAEGWRSS